MGCGGLFQRDVAFGIDAGFALGDVLLAELLDLAGYLVAVVLSGAYAFLLKEGVDAAMLETAFVVDGNLDDGGMGGDACQAHAVGRTEVAETIDDKAPVVDFGGTHDVRAVAIDDVGTVVDAEMGELAQRAAVLAKERLGAVGQVALGAAFCSAVEGYDDDVGLLLQVVKDALDDLQVGVFQRVAVMAEGAQPYPHALAGDDGRLYAPFDACKLNALFVQTLL